MLAPLLKRLESINHDIWGQVMLWGLPPFVIPGLRFLNDPPETRLNLFFRDFLTYSLGAMVFGATSLGLNKGLRAVPGIQDKTRHFVSMAGGLAANLLFVGLGSVPLAHRIEKALRKNSSSSPVVSGSPVRVEHKSGKRLNLESTGEMATSKLAASSVGSAIWHPPVGLQTRLAPKFADTGAIYVSGL